MFGFAPKYGVAGVPGADPAGKTADASSAPAFAFDETDPALPEEVASVPTTTGRVIEATAAAEAAPADGATVATAQIVPSEETPQQVAALTEAPATTSDPSAAVSQGHAQAETVKAAPAATTDIAPQKRGFLSAFFSQQPASAAPSPIIDQTPRETAEQPVQIASVKPIIDLEDSQPGLASTESATPRPVMISTGSIGSDALPGVRANDGLFEISRRSGIDDESDIDLNEDGGGLYQVASAAGLARLAPNGLVTQHGDVDVSCLKPSLVRMLKTIEARFGQRAVITSGYRSQERNRRARGAKNSLHMACAAVDIQIPGVSKTSLSEFARSMPGRGGVGTYCHTQSVHVDVGPERDWNWRCRRRS